MTRNAEFDIAQRTQALSLHAEGSTRATIQEKTGYSPSGFTRLLQKAKQRGYVVGGVIINAHVEDKPRTGRPATRKAMKNADYVEVVEKSISNRDYPPEKTGGAIGMLTTSA
jgi:hypothetical protein